MPGGLLRLRQELLPDQVRLLGPDYSDALSTRNNIAAWTGQCGDAQEALRLSRELRALGPDHTDVLFTRANIAHWTARADGKERHKSAADPQRPISRKSDQRIMSPMVFHALHFRQLDKGISVAAATRNMTAELPRLLS
jgi:hypothetical protein